MYRNHSLAFVAGLAGGVAAGLALSQRRQPSLRRVMRQASREGIADIRHLAASATDAEEKTRTAFLRRQDALRSAFEAGRKSYLKAAR
jgi:hypothetical protein